MKLLFRVRIVKALIFIVSLRTFWSTGKRSPLKREV